MVLDSQLKEARRLQEQGPGGKLRGSPTGERGPMLPNPTNQIGMVWAEEDLAS